LFFFIGHLKFIDGILLFSEERPTKISIHQ
jgi:hypothetical protein